MTPKDLLDEINRLPLEERIKLVAELNRRLDNPSPEPSLSWDEVRARLRKQR